MESAPSSPTPILSDNASKFVKKGITWPANTGHFLERAYIWNVKDVPIHHMSKGDRNTGSKEIGTSLKCSFPLSSEPQHLTWLDPCHLPFPGRAGQWVYGKPWCWAPWNSEGPGTRSAAGGMAVRVPIPQWLEKVWEKQRGNISPHCESPEGRSMSSHTIQVLLLITTTDNIYLFIHSCQVLW